MTAQSSLTIEFLFIGSRHTGRVSSSGVEGSSPHRLWDSRNKVTYNNTNLVLKGVVLTESDNSFGILDTKEFSNNETALVYEKDRKNFLTVEVTTIRPSILAMNNTGD